MEENWQAELNAQINSQPYTRTNTKLTKISSLFVLLLVVLAVPAFISGTQDQRSRASGNPNTLKMNLNVPICSTQENQSCGYNQICTQEGASCEFLHSCQNGNSSNDSYICKNGKWTYTTTLNKGYCNLCGQQSQTATETNEVSPTPTVFQGPTQDPYLHRPKK